MALMGSITDIGGRLRAARKAAGLSQGDIANVLGVTITSISEWELGKKMPRIEHLPALRKQLLVSLDHLVCGDQRPEWLRQQMAVHEGASVYAVAKDGAQELRQRQAANLFVQMTEPQQRALVDLMRSVVLLPGGGA